MALVPLGCCSAINWKVSSFVIIGNLFLTEENPTASFCVQQRASTVVLSQRMIKSGGLRESMESSKKRRCSNYLLIILLTVILSPETFQIAEAGKKNIHITDDLDDVVDNEEDESWKEWGKKKQPAEFDPPPDFSKMELMDIQEEMMKRQTGPVFGFVKLRLGVKRTADMITELAMKWTKVARTGAIEAQFMGVDSSTIMFTMQRGQDSTELREFVLEQPEAYEIKIGDALYRRPGDPPLEAVIERLRSENEKSSVDDDGDDNEKDEL